MIEKMPTLILLNFQVYQAPDSVMMNQRVDWFLDLAYLISTALGQCHGSQLSTCKEPMEKQRAVFICT